MDNLLKRHQIALFQQIKHLTYLGGKLVHEVPNDLDHPRVASQAAPDEGRTIGFTVGRH